MKATTGHVADLLAKGKIIGRIAGASEYGPRALGNRSILADPRDPTMAARLNALKHREAFRPFAASCIYEYGRSYFDLPCQSPFMLIACKVLTDKLPAVTHVDGSCRVQTVTREQNPGFYALIEDFGKRTGVFCLLNTSLNDEGEPIAEDYWDAQLTMAKTGLDGLWFEDDDLVLPPTDPAVAIGQLNYMMNARIDSRYRESIAMFCDEEKYRECMNEI